MFTWLIRSFVVKRDNNHEDTCIWEHPLMIFNTTISSFFSLVVIPSTPWSMSFMNVQNTCPITQQRWRGLKSTSMRYSLASFYYIYGLESTHTVLRQYNMYHAFQSLCPPLWSRFHAPQRMNLPFSSFYCWLSNEGIKCPKDHFKKGVVLKKWRFTNSIYAPQRMNPLHFGQAIICPLVL